jgi:hypothetical protein
MPFIHPVVILLAILLGIYTGTLGWKRFRFRSGRIPASAFPWQKHVRYGKTFYVLLWLGFLIGLGVFFYRMGKIFGAGLHGYLAVVILFLFSIGAALGWKLSKGKGSSRLAMTHMVVNFSTFLVVLIQVVMGMILLTLFLQQ